MIDTAATASACGLVAAALVDAAVALAGDLDA